MKYTLWTVVLAALLVLSAAPAAAAKNDKDAPSVEQMERHERLLGFKAREAELEHQQSMRELELEQRRIEIERMRSGRRWRHKRHGGGFLLLIVVTNILLTVWVCRDMREQKIGRALWVPITLLAGVFGAIVYAIARNADIRQGRGK